MRLIYPELSERPERRRQDSRLESCKGALYVALVASSALWIVGAIYCAILALTGIPDPQWGVLTFSPYALAHLVGAGAVCGLLARLLK